MKSLIAYAPIAVYMYASDDFMLHKTGVFSGCPSFDESVDLINHAVLVVGYDRAGNYIIKNSWGVNWGDQGYAVVSKDADCAFSYYPLEIRGTNKQLFEKFVIGAIFALFSFLCL